MLKPIAVSEQLFDRVRRAARRAPREGSHQPPLWLVFDRAVEAALDAEPQFTIEAVVIFRSDELAAHVRAGQAALVADIERVIAADDELTAIRGY